VRLWPRRAGEPETKADAVLPESVWEAVLAAGDLGGGLGGPERAVGLPAVLAVIRLIAHAVALVPLYAVQDDELRARAYDTWQWRLFKRPGPPPTTAFHLKADIAANFAGRGNAYVRKYKPTTLSPGRPRVVELASLNAGKVKPKRSNGRIVFEDSTETNQPVTRTTDDIVQIRSFSLGDGLEGLSPITAARMLVSAGLKRAEFEETHLKNGIFPGIGVKFPEGVTEEDGERWIKFLESKHKGTSKAGKILGVGGGGELIPIPISLEDAQFAEITQLTIQQAAAMYQVPPGFVTARNTPPTEAEWRYLITFCLGPILEAMTQAFSADRDLFDAVADGESLEAHADPDVLLRLDAKVKAEVQHMQVQDGLRLVDELRAADGLGPLPPVPEDWTQAPGQVPQVTPVGGAPNPIAGTKPPEPPMEGDPTA
jgi:HK97 family phage portal protein